MNKNEFKIQIENKFNNFDSSFFEKIEMYKTFLQEYNKVTNLTRLDKDDIIYGSYFFDSIIPFANIDFNRYKNVLDIGSGSGIPGIVIKLLYSSIELSIIESNGKKVTFLKQLCEKLDIKVNIYCKRAEVLRNNEREKYDIVTSRAVSELSTIIEISVPYCKVGGILIEPKGSNYLEELKNSDEIIKNTCLNVKTIINIDSKNNVIILEKEDITDKKYPRKWSMIIKQH
jgi:16S rRNA (guanine527-N7)-methyltransferase